MNDPCERRWADTFPQKFPLPVGVWANERAVQQLNRSRCRLESSCRLKEQHFSWTSTLMEPCTWSIRLNFQMSQLVATLECHIKFSRIKVPCDAAFRQNSFTTCCDLGSLRLSWPAAFGRRKYTVSYCIDTTTITSTTAITNVQTAADYFTDFIMPRSGGIKRSCCPSVCLSDPCL